MIEEILTYWAVANSGSVEAIATLFLCYLVLVGVVHKVDKLFRSAV